MPGIYTISGIFFCENAMVPGCLVFTASHRGRGNDLVGLQMYEDIGDFGERGDNVGLNPVAELVRFVEGHVAIDLNMEVDVDIVEPAAGAELVATPDAVDAEDDCDDLAGVSNGDGVAEYAGFLVNNLPGGPGNEAGNDQGDDGVQDGVAQLDGNQGNDDR